LRVAEGVAATLMAAKLGLKASAGDFATYRAAQARVAAIFGKALTT